MHITTRMRQAIGGTFLAILTISLMATQYLFGSTTYTPPVSDPSPLPADTVSDVLADLTEPSDAYEVLRLHFTGSIVIGSMLGTQTHGTFNAAVLESGTKPWLSDCAKLFTRDEMTFALLDTVLTDNAALPTRSKSERVWYMAPAYHAKILADGGIDTVSLAAPHSLDYGTDGLADTVSALSDYDIAWGDGTHAVYREKNGVRLGVYTTSVRLNDPDDAYAVPYDASVLSWIENAVEKCDWTAVYLTVDDAHPVSDDALLAFAGLCADHGADLVLLDIDPYGSPVTDEHAGTQIVYGLGAFLSGGERLTDAVHSVLEIRLRTEDGKIIGSETEILPFVADAVEPWIILSPDPAFPSEYSMGQP